MAEPISIQQLKNASEDAISLAEFIYKPADFMVTRRLAPSINTLQYYIDSFEAAKAEADSKVAHIETTVQDAINNTAIEGGILADTFVVVDATLNQRQINRGFESIADILSIANPNNGLRVYVKSYHAGLNKGGGYFTYDSSKSSVNNGGLIINGWVRDHKSIVTPEDFGAVVYNEGNPIDVSTNLHSMFDASYEHGIKWLVPANNYYVDGTIPIEIRTGGDCYGAFLLPRNNKVCWFTVERDKGNIDEVFSVDEWGSLNRNTLVRDANNCADRVVYISSSEVACVRIGYNYNYLKQERIRIDSRGRSTTPLVYTYNDKSTITVRAFQNSKPITINGFRVERVGADADYSRGAIIINRDLVTLNDACVINDSYTLQAKQGIEVTYCADVTLNRPIINNVNFGGSGYGIRCIGTIGVIISDAIIEQARHGVSGGYNVDMQVYRGVISGIDDHWGARLLVDGTTIAVSDVNGAGSISYAGNDATIRNVTQIGGSYFFGIRNDQLSCGGDIVLENIKISVRSGENTYFYLYGISTIADQPVPTDNMVAIPLMPENVIINNITFEGAAEVKQLHVVRLTGIPHAFRGHRNISIKNIITNGLRVSGLFKSKSIHEVEDVNGTISIENMDCNGGVALYITSALETMHPNAYTIKLKNVSNTWLRVGLSSTKRLEVNNGSISQIIKEGNSLWSGTSSMAIFKGVEFTGGNVYQYIDNSVFINCLFTGDVTQFVTSSRASYIGCAKTVALTAIPDTIDLNYHLSPPLLATTVPVVVP